MKYPIAAAFTIMVAACAAPVFGAPLQFPPAFSPPANGTQTNTTVSPPAANPAEMPEGLRDSPETFLSQDSLTGDWGGLRSNLSDHGISVTPVYEAEVFGSGGTGHDGTVSDGLIDIAADFDLERLTHFWSDATFHFNVLDIYGNSLSAKYVGDIGNTSNIAGYNTFRLQEIWLQQNFWEKRFSLRVGMLAADSEYFTSQASSVFLNGTFGAFTLLAANFNDAPVYPVAAPAVRLDFAPVSFLDFKLGVFAPNGSTDQFHQGVDFGIDPQDGALFALEASYLYNQSPNDRGLVGTYKVGAFIQRGGYASWGSQADNALDPSQSLHHGTNWAVYGVGDQEIFKNGNYTIEAFARGGFASTTYSFVTNYFDAGFNFIGVVPTRDDDIIGIAAARSGIGNRFSDAQVEQGELPYTGETVFEATYKAILTPWWSIQPDFQYVLNPGGQVHSRNAYVLGIRTTLTF